MSSGSIVTSTRGKRSAIGAALFAARLCGDRVLLVVVGLVCGNGLLDIFERQTQLIGIELLRAPAELRTLQLAEQMAQAIELGERLVTFGDRRITFGAHRLHQRMQRFDFGRELGYDLDHARY